MDFPESRFWDFSLHLYGTDGVADACLRLQDRHGLDVNFMFFCIWAAASGRRLPPDGIRARHDTITSWHEEVVRHLRHLRRRLKGGVPPVENALVQGLRARIQKIEIDAEHVEQLTLAATLEGAADDPAGVRQPGDDARTHLHDYLALIGVEPDAADLEDLEFLVAQGLATSRSMRTE